MSEEDRKVMVELVGWLEGMECLARDVYTASAEALRSAPGFHRFLTRLAREESEHAELMAQLRASVARRDAAPPSGIRFGKGLRRSIEAPLRAMLAEADSGTLTCGRALAMIAEVEFAEVNEVFLYVMRTFGGETREAEHAAAIILAHEKGIREFIGCFPPEERPQADTAKLANIWSTRLLVVDDNALVRDLIAGLLKSQGEVLTAENGALALDSVRRHFFDAVVSDIRMPVMGGIEFHRRAIVEYPDLRGRFVLMSTDAGIQDQEYLAMHHVPFLDKPFELDDLLSVVQSLVRRPPRTAPADAPVTRRR